MPLKPEQLQELKGALTKRREFLEVEAHADAAKAREDVYSQSTGPVADTGDEATADLISDVENAELSRDLQELREIDSALARISEGRYGTCIDCGGEIGLARLRSEPTAKRCIACQSAYEKKFLQPGKPTL
ncbi:MAG TPA: TraR/DksA family transcriptional regulator [Burkholderiales bacterium]|nr:TraR/DksA family transcriptional regulator [Burkholderiales bacterium]